MINIGRFFFLQLTFLMVVTVACSKKDESVAPNNPTPEGGSAPAKLIASTTKKVGSTDQPKQNSGKLGKPELTIDPETWATEFKKDIRAAYEKYKGKVVELSGVVDSATDDLQRDDGSLFGSIIFKTTETVGCQVLLPWESKPLLRVAPGSKIKVKGRLKDPRVASNGEFDFKFYFPTLDFGEVLEVGTNPGVIISCENLAKEFAEKGEGLNEKYYGKWMYVDGELVSSAPWKESDSGKLFKFKGTKGVMVEVIMDATFRNVKKELESVKVGQKLKVFGKFGGFGLEDNCVNLGRGVLLEAR